MSKVSSKSLNDLEIHDLALRTPAMNDIQFKALRMSLAEQGQLEPIRLYRGKVIDGRHRIKAARELEWENINTVSEASSQSIEDVEQKVLHGWENRRHQTVTQKAIFAYNEFCKLRREGNTISQGAVAQQFGVSRLMLSRAKTLDELVSDDILNVLFNGGKINIGLESNPQLTDSLGSLINHFRANTQKILASSDGSSSMDDFTDDEIRSIYSKVDELKNEFSNRLLKKMTNILYAELKDQ